MKTETKKYSCPTYNPIDICFTKGKGVWLYDEDEKKYLDCLCAYGAVNFGHCNNEIAKMIASQIRKLNVVSGVVYNDKIINWFVTAEKYLDFNNSILLTSGTEAVDVAIKFMRLYGKRGKRILSTPKIIVFKGNYHGQSNTIISFSDMLETKIVGHDSSFILVEYNNIVEFKKAVSHDVCGVLIEPIQCQNGFNIPDIGFLTQIQNICNAHDIILAVDEVQTGLGRTGKLFFYQYEGVKPDIVIIGKSLGGGILPVSAVLMNNKIAHQLKVGDHGGTFANNTLSAHIAAYSIVYLFKRKLIENSKIMGSYLLNNLKNILIENKDCVNVYGVGLLICIELNCNAEIYCQKLLHESVFCKKTKETKIRITPPLTITKNECDFIINAFVKVFC